MIEQRDLEVEGPQEHINERVVAIYNTRGRFMKAAFLPGIVAVTLAAGVAAFAAAPAIINPDGSTDKITVWTSIRSYRDCLMEMGKGPPGKVCEAARLGDVVPGTRATELEQTTSVQSLAMIKVKIEEGPLAGKEGAVPIGYFTGTDDKRTVWISSEKYADCLRELESGPAGPVCAAAKLDELAAGAQVKVLDSNGMEKIMILDGPNKGKVGYVAVVHFKGR